MGLMDESAAPFCPSKLNKQQARSCPPYAAILVASSVCKFGESTPPTKALDRLLRDLRVEKA